MPPFPKPQFDFSYDVGDEIRALKRYRDTKPGRAIPAKADNRMLLVTWNIANLGVQQRRDTDYKLIAEILRWFDIAAVQEVNDNLSGLRGIQAHLPGYYRLLISDAAGNGERLAYFFDGRKIKLLEKVGEVALPPKDLKDVALPGVTAIFNGFDRTPYLAAFEAGSLRFLLVNVHLFFGSEAQADIERRSLETFAVALWADRRRRSRNAYVKDIIALGDFNLPKKNASDPIFRALTRRGLELPDHSSEVGSSIASDSHYDQIAFFPGETQDDFTGQMGIFDFDGAVFANLWQTRPKKDFLAYTRYYLSDHRPMWAQFKI